ncbi:MAG: radical SAM protein [Clostridiales bacterium]|nr:radical SAM protein [Clostridiales bacterium]
MRRLTLVMTHQCNFDCKYCLQKHEDVFMPVELGEKAIERMRQELLSESSRKDSSDRSSDDPEETSSTKVQISFYGGEPLLARDRIEHLVKYANERIGGMPGYSVRYEITTNGLLLDESFLSFAKKNRILLALSHDGLAQDQVRLARGGKPTREIVDQKLEMLLRAFPETIIMMTIHPDYVDQVADSIAFFHEKGIRSVSLVPAHGERVSWTEEKFRRFSQQMEKVKVLYERWNQGDGYFRVIPFENKIRNYIRQKDADSAMCHFGCHKLMVDADGKYYPCSHFIGRDGFCIGSVEDDVDEAKIRTLESRRVEPEICRACDLRFRCRHTCACANHGHTGSMAEVSALQCEYEKLTIRLADEAAAAMIREENPRFVERMYKP